MSLEAGTRLGTFEIVAPLGAGGMGEVYRARDTRLGRDVAIKVLPSSVNTDPVALGRFEREAKAVAALNHPNILAIYDFATHDGITYAVMELLRGKTLRSLLQEGPLSPQRTVPFSIQLAQGLAAAHEKGIVHRDLKPENILITTEDRVKILDFGLAKPVAAPSPDENASTQTEYTNPGTVMGTAGYMSPEQVRGDSVDHRSDLFSVGAILYEIVTGRRAFSRNTGVETMAAVLREEPPPFPDALNVPPAFLRIIQHCLEKDPEKRFQAARDLAFALEAISLRETAPMAVPPERAKLPRFLAPLALIAAIAVLGVLVFRSIPREQRNPHQPGTGTLQQLTTDPGYEGEPTFSPDGETIAYVSDREGNFEIYLQQISGGEPINLTRNPAADVQPAFSRDGRQIAFVSSRSGTSHIFTAAPGLPLVGGDIWIMPALGGAARRIVENGNFPSWSPDGRWIVYTHGTFRQAQIAVVSAEGGAPRNLDLQNLDVQRLFYPTYSEDSKWILFQNGTQIYVIPAEGGQPRFLLDGGRPCWGTGSRSILYTSYEAGKNRTLREIAFSTATGKTEGEPWVITFGRGLDTGAALSPNGQSLVFSAQDQTLNLEELPFDAELGRVTGEPREITRGANQVNFFSSSPEGNSVVFAASRGMAQHLWRIDGDSAPIQLTQDPDFDDTSPGWSPDGRRIVFMRSTLNKTQNESAIWLISPDGANPRRLLASGQFPAWLDSKRILVQTINQLSIIDADTSAVTQLPMKVRTLFSADRKGEWLAYQTGDRGNIDLAAVSLSGGQPRVIVATPHEDYHPSFSPSGNWLYFQEDHKNLYRVPGPAQQWREAQPEKVTDFPEDELYLEDPQVAPTGTKLFYTRGKTTADLWLLQFQGATPAKN